MRFSVGEVVEAGACARRFALRASGAPLDRPSGTPVGSIVHDCMRGFAERATAGDARLARALAPSRPLPDEVAAAATALVDELLLERVRPIIGQSLGGELQRAARALRELARLLSTLMRRARVAGTAAAEVPARVFRAAERPVTLRLDTPAGPAEIAGRIDLLVGNEVDGREEVWELKTHADLGPEAEDQAALYALALADGGPQRSPPRPAVLHLTGDGRVVLRAVAFPDGARVAEWGARVAAMVGWAASPPSAPPTDDHDRCVHCPVRTACWDKHGSTLVPAGAAVAARHDVLLGHNEKGAPVHWSPHSTDGGAALENFGLLVTGDAGAGKTQTLRAVVSELRAAGLPVLLFDFKNDYSEPSFTRAANLRVHDVRDAGLPHNPLSLLPEAGQIRPTEHAHNVASVFARVLHLGVRQEEALRQAILRRYGARGLTGVRLPSRTAVAGPSFAEVARELADHPTLGAHLNPLVDLGLLPDEGAARDDLADLLSTGTVLNLSRLDEKYANVLAELLLLAIYAHLLGGDQPRRLTRLLVIDEAHRVTRSSALERLLREGRAFGAGFALATQYPGDLSDEIQGTLATRLFLHNSQESHRATIVRQLCGSSAGGEAVALKRFLGSLGKLEGLIANAHHHPYRWVRILPHHKRGTLSGS